MTTPATVAIPVPADLLSELGNLLGLRPDVPWTASAPTVGAGVWSELQRDGKPELSVEAALDPWAQDWPEGVPQRVQELAAAAMALVLTAATSPAPTGPRVITKLHDWPGAGLHGFERAVWFALHLLAEGGEVQIGIYDLIHASGVASGRNVTISLAKLQELGLLEVRDGNIYRPLAPASAGGAR